MQQINRERRQAERANTNGAVKKEEYRAEPETGWKGGEGIKGQWGTGARRHHISHLAFPILHFALHISHCIGILPRFSFHIAPLVLSFSNPPTQSHRLREFSVVPPFQRLGLVEERRPSHRKREGRPPRDCPNHKVDELDAEIVFNNHIRSISLKLTSVIPMSVLPMLVVPSVVYLRFYITTISPLDGANLSTFLDQPWAWISREV